MRLATRLLLIIGLCLIPTLGFQLLTSWTQWMERKAQLDDLAVHQAELLAGNVEGIAEAARILLGTATEFTQIRTIGEQCSPRLASLRQHAKGVAFIVLVDSEGRIRCASDPSLLNVVHSAWTRSVEAHAAPFSAGRFTRLPAWPDPILPFLRPFSFNDQARTQGTLIAAVDLNWLTQRLIALKRAGSPFLASGVLTIADADGVILGRDVRHGEFVGRTFPSQATPLLHATDPGTLRLKSIDETERIIGYTPPTPANYNLTAVVGFFEPDLLIDIRHSLLRGILVLGAISLAALVLTLVVARRFITRPTRALLETIQRWREGDLAARAPAADFRSEFGQIATSYNEMASALQLREEELRGYAEQQEAHVAKRTQELVHTNARLKAEIAERQEAEAALLQAQKVQAVGQLAGGIAHDFNNILQGVLGSASLIRRRAKDPAAVERLAAMTEDAARRGQSITRRLLAFSRREELRADILDLRELLEGLQEVLTATLGVHCKVDIKIAQDLASVIADRGQLETILVNLATNARDAMPEGGVLTLAACVEHVDEHACMAAGDYIHLTVTDTGVGMSAETLARATEPFFSTKAMGQGTGLGLALARSFAKGSGGTLAIASAPGAGTTVSLWLPVASQPVELPRLTTSSTPAVHHTSGDHRPRVLLVDDEPLVRDVLAAQLEDAGYAVIEEANGAAALEIVDQAEHIDVLVSDLAMPGMDGLTLLREAQRRRPGLPAILITGYAGDAARLAVGTVVEGTFVLMRKPVTGTQLTDQIATLLQASQNA